MKSMRNLVAYFLALAMAAFATPSLAQNIKYFELTQPITPIAVTVTTIDVYFKNVEGGNSSFNSLAIEGISLDGASVIIKKAVAASPWGPGTPSGGSTNKFTLTDLSPVKRNETVKVTLTVELSTNGCTDGRIEWRGSAWTGSPSQPSNEFKQRNISPQTLISAGCTYSITSFTPTSVKRGTTVTGTATVKNTSMSAVSLGDLVLAAPANSGASITATKDDPTKWPIPSGGQAIVNLTISAECDPVDSTTAVNWTLTPSPSSFTRSGGVTPSTSVTGKCGLQVVLPSSFAVGRGSDVTVKFFDANGDLENGTGDVNIAVNATGSCALDPLPLARSLSGGQVVFSQLTLTGTSANCSLTASALIDGKQYSSSNSSFTIFKKVLSCVGDVDAMIADWSADPPPDLTLAVNANQFDGSPGVNSIGTVKYYKGARGELDLTPSDPPKPTVCVPVNYTIVNNIGGSDSDSTTQPGKTVPKNGAALFWDEVSQPNATFRVVTTFADEWTDASGWIASRTKVCLNDACTKTYPLKACLGTALVAASVPLYGADAPEGFPGKRMPGCIVGEVWTTVVPVTGSACLSVTPPSASSACVRVTSESLFIGDPVFIR